MRPPRPVTTAVASVTVFVTSFVSTVSCAVRMIWRGVTTGATSPWVCVPLPIVLSSLDAAADSELDAAALDAGALDADPPALAEDAWLLEHAVTLRASAAPSARTDLRSMV